MNPHMQDYDTRASALLPRLHTHHSPKATTLAARLVKLLGTDSPKLISTVHEAEATLNAPACTVVEHSPHCPLDSPHAVMEGDALSSCHPTVAEAQATAAAYPHA